MRVFMTGGTGYIGRALAQALAKRGDAVVVLSRSAEPAVGKVSKLEVLAGDPSAPGEWMQRLAGCDAVVHLAGEPIAGRRWSQDQKQRLIDSRVDGTSTVVTAIGETPVDVR